MPKVPKRQNKANEGLPCDLIVLAVDADKWAKPDRADCRCEGSNRLRIGTIALVAHLPTIFSQRENLETGGLMSYGPSFPDMNRRAGDYVDKILRGTKPGDIPVEQPTKFDLVINLITARALGVTIPPTMLVRADEVME